MCWSAGKRAFFSTRRTFPGGSRLTKTDWFVVLWFLAGGAIDGTLSWLGEESVTGRFRYWTERWPPFSGIVAALLTLAIWHLFVEDLYWRLRK